MNPNEITEHDPNLFNDVLERELDGHAEELVAPLGSRAMPASKRLPPDDRRCDAVGKNGERCKAWASTSVLAETGERLCAGHAGRGLAASPQAAAAAARLTNDRRREQALDRRERVQTAVRSTKEALALAAEELRDEIVAAYRDAIETGDHQALRRAEAAERLLSRVYGKPTEKVETTVGVPETIEQLRAMTPQQRLSLLHRLGEGKRLRLIDTSAD